MLGAIEYTAIRSIRMRVGADLATVLFPVIDMAPYGVKKIKYVNT
jgi:hypothetical protein